MAGAFTRGPGTCHLDWNSRHGCDDEMRNAVQDRPWYFSDTNLLTVTLFVATEFQTQEFGLYSICQNLQGCIQKFQDSTCKKKFAYLGC